MKAESSKPPSKARRWKGRRRIRALKAMTGYKSTAEKCVMKAAVARTKVNAICQARFSLFQRKIKHVSITKKPGNSNCAQAEYALEIPTSLKLYKVAARNAARSSKSMQPSRKATQVASRLKDSCVPTKTRRTSCVISNAGICIQTRKGILKAATLDSVPTAGKSPPANQAWPRATSGT